jgi:hypothetical protein
MADPFLSHPELRSPAPAQGSAAKVLPMTESSETNVTQLRPAKAKDVTGATRARRFRTKKRKASVTRTVTPAMPATVTVSVPTGEILQSEKPNDIKGSVTVRHGRGVMVCTTIAALSLATVSAGFSITGMTSIFVGAYWPVIGMGVALELGKLSAVAALGHLQGGRLKATLVALVAVLMGLNAIGAYGFLAKAHIGHALDGNLAVAGRAADVDARLSVQTSLVADLDRQLAQIDAAVEKATSKGRTNAAMRLADDQRKTRAALAGKRITEAKTLAALQVEKASIEGERAKVEADLGPVRYLATLLGATDENVMRWFILAIALLLDPAAVLLLLAATRRATP